MGQNPSQASEMDSSYLWHRLKHACCRDAGRDGRNATPAQEGPTSPNGLGKSERTEQKSHHPDCCKSVPGEREGPHEEFWMGGWKQRRFDVEEFGEQEHRAGKHQDGIQLLLMHQE